MSANMDTTEGQTAFVSAREDAWHRSGTVLPDCFTADDAMKYGLLANWRLRKSGLVTPLELGDGGIVNLSIPNKYAIVRDNPVNQNPEVLGVVGEAYTIVQNEELAGLLDALVEESGAHFETAGAIDGGRKVFITMKLPGHIQVGGVDRVDNYLAAMTSHDGSTSTVIMVTPVRIVCQNTLNLAFSAASHMFRVRHTVGAHRILLQQAREALEFTFKYLEGFQEEAEQLINTPLKQATFEEIIQANFGAPEDAAPATVTRSQAKVDQMVQLFADANTQEGIRETAWAGLNALTEWNDHYSPVRGAGADSEEIIRSRKAVLDPGFKNKARDLMLALV